MRRTGWLVVVLAGLVPIAVGKGDEPHWLQPEAGGWTRSTDHDPSMETLGIRINRFAGTYVVGQPVPVTVEIANFGGKDPAWDRLRAQLGTHLDIMETKLGRAPDSPDGAPPVPDAFNGSPRYHRFDLGIRRQMVGESAPRTNLTIEKYAKYTKDFNLAQAIALNKPGEYRVVLGYHSYFSSDIGTWTGHLDAPAQVVRIVAAGAVPPVEAPVVEPNLAPASTPALAVRIALPPVSTEPADHPGPVPARELIYPQQPDPWRTHFAVLVTNVSPVVQRVYTDSNSWGYEALAFEVTDEHGPMRRVEKVGREWGKNMAHWSVLEPGETVVMDVYYTDKQVWSDFPCPSPHRSEAMTIRAVLTMEPFGRIVSDPVPIVVRNYGD